MSGFAIIQFQVLLFLLATWCGMVFSKEHRLPWSIGFAGCVVATAIMAVRP